MAEELTTLMTIGTLFNLVALVVLLFVVPWFGVLLLLWQGYAFYRGAKISQDAKFQASVHAAEQELRN